MKVLVTGAKGQLGADVIKELQIRNIEWIGAGFEDFDITDKRDSDSFIYRCGPDTVIHCAAYTSVDKAEEQPELCKAVNLDGTRNVANACKKIGAKMIYISTDYVFSGKGKVLYETDDATGPLNVYGQTKLAGEEVIKSILTNYYIVRTSWVFGSNGSNFIKTMIDLSKSYDEINVVADQYGSPTYAEDLSPLLCDMLQSEKYGTYHATNEGICSWAELAEEVFRITGTRTKVNFITSEEFPAKARRPKNSRLSKKSLDEAGFKRLPEWKDAVQRYIATYEGEGEGYERKSQ